MYCARVVVLVVPLLIAAWARSAGAGCEISIQARGPGFEFSYYDIVPYAQKAIGTDATADSLYYASIARLYDKLARALAVAAQVHRDIQFDGEPRREIRELVKGPHWTLIRVEDYLVTPRADTVVVGSPRQAVSDSAATLYAVQVGSFVERRNALTRLRLLRGLAKPHAERDSTRIVHWWQGSCGNGGPHDADLFMLGPDEAPGPGYKVLHGLFIDRRDAFAAVENVRQRFELPATMTRVRVTGRVLHSVVRPKYRVDE
jgi:hypothetical protein